MSRLISDNNNNINELNISQDDETYINWIVTHSTPKAIPTKRIGSESLADKTIEAVKIAMNTNDWSDTLTAPFKNSASEFCFADDIILRGARIVLPECLRDQALELAHEGHPGMSVMKRRLREKVWWPKIDDQVENFVKKCKSCTLVSAPSPPKPLSRRNLPSAPWEHLAIDHMGPLPSKHYLLVNVDYYSRYKEVEIVTQTDATTTIKKLKRIFARLGVPLSIQADNGPSFNSQEFERFCNDNNIKLNNGIPYWPQQNGEVERQNRSLLKRLKISQLEKRNWQDDFEDYLLMYRSTKHSTTMMSPAEMTIYSLQENFISTNAYTCIEINAHSLVLLITKLRALNRPDLMLTHLLGSQSCESTFRLFVSGTEKFINYQCQIQPTFLPTSEIHFDGDIDSEDLNDPDDMYSDDDELSQDVQSSVKDVGEGESEEELRKDLHTLSELSGPINLKDYDAFGVDINENSPYCAVSDASGNVKIVRKPSLCWLLSKDKHSLSSDRLTRVKQCELIDTSKIQPLHFHFALANKFINLQRNIRLRLWLMSLLKTA